MTLDEILRELRELEAEDYNTGTVARAYTLATKFGYLPINTLWVEEVKDSLVYLAQVAACVEAFDNIDPGILGDALDEDTLDVLHGMGNAIREAADVLGEE